MVTFYLRKVHVTSHHQGLVKSVPIKAAPVFHCSSKELLENPGTLQHRGGSCCTAPGTALGSLHAPVGVTPLQFRELTLDQHRRQGTDGRTRGHQEQELLRDQAGNEHEVTAVPSSGLCPLSWLPAPPSLGDDWEGAGVQLSPAGSGEGEPPLDKPPGKHHPPRLQGAKTVTGAAERCITAIQGGSSPGAACPSRHTHPPVAWDSEKGLY